MVEFVSYNGSYPNLCRGQLIVRINNKEINLGACLTSGGDVWFDEYWDENIDEGEWFVDVPKQYEEYEEEITRIVNENVPYGCCGGCV